MQLSLNSACFAFDTETVDGEPLSLQFATGGGGTFDFVTRTTILPTFLKFLLAHGSRLSSSVLFAHNLEFDLAVVFIEHHRALWSARRFETTFEIGSEARVTLTLVSTNNPYARIDIAGRRWLLLDTMSFFRRSLENASTLLRLPVQKLARPSYIGERAPSEQERPYFIQYAINDALATLELGRFIIARHQELELPLTVSLPSMAAETLRRRFMMSPTSLKESDGQSSPVRIPLCETSPGCNDVLQASLLSYHGGKSALHVAPGIYDDVRVVDIVSAYPHAMTSLPPLTSGHWKHVTEHHPENAGIYHVRGRMRSSCPYGCLALPTTQRGARLHYVREGTFDTWTTGWELESASALSEIDIDSLEGYVWFPDADAANPFARYVEHFFALKQRSDREDPRREMHKLLLNSLYGKTIQRQHEQNQWIAGGLFNPFWASQITGHCRARLHALEHQYNALHSSTDSIITRHPNIPEGDGLGDLQVEALGRLVVLRTKLYAVFPETGRKPKMALHGFRGRPDDFVTLLRTAEPTYKVRHMIRPRESLRTGQKPLRMIDRTMTLGVSPDILRAVQARLRDHQDV